ncbi:hypothetical protein BCR39DRAFT_470655 [Naematelia encephala]|uniref:Mediator of RNA polymerase II transcription subunit 10 n=1 Tax=Naematelia encephala TaxID=71784 RepID=A0A1Y2AUL6_9TREE|nr:hypothetical protein BCR39DRAFT_470655 [Naematelia encephala]
MSLVPPHLPSPAATPDEHLATQAAVSVDSEQRQAQIRAEVEAQLLRLSQDLYEMEICAGEVGMGMEERVPRYMMEVSEALVRLEELSGRMEDSVPKQILEYNRAVDQHRNPHVYTKSTLTRAAGENQYALGRMLGLENFRRQLQSALAEEFPSVDLPDRRHVPDWERNAGQIKENGEVDLKENGESGVRENGESGVRENGESEVKENGESGGEHNGESEIKVEDGDTVPNGQVEGHVFVQNESLELTPTTTPANGSL